MSNACSSFVAADTPTHAAEGEGDGEGKDADAEPEDSDSFEGVGDECVDPHRMHPILIQRQRGVGVGGALFEI